MQVQKINSPSFGKIILDCNDPIPADIVFIAEKKINEIKGNTIDPIQFINGNLLPKVIETDYNTPTLINRFKELVKLQENNKHDIHLDLFLYDESEIPLYPEGWYQRATVGNKVFKQRLYEFQGSAIKFLEDACKYADRLRGKPVKEVLTSAAETTTQKPSVWENFKKFLR